MLTLFFPVSLLSQGAGEILGDILDATSQAGPAQEQGKRESLEDLQRQFEELFLRPSPSSFCPPVRAAARSIDPSPTIPFLLFRPEPTRPASACPPCPSVRRRRSPADGPPVGAAALSLCGTHEQLVDRSGSTRLDVGTRLLRCTDLLRQRQQFRSDRGDVRPDEFNRSSVYVLAAGRRRREVGGQEEDRAEVGPASAGPRVIEEDARCDLG